METFSTLIKKGQFNCLNTILFLLLLSILFSWKKKKRARVGVLIFAAIFFAVTSTSYLPAYLTQRAESAYTRFDPKNVSIQNDSLFIQCLGGGYASDASLAPTQQLSWVSLGRLVEAVRIARLYPKSKLIVSGHVASGNKSMAQVYKAAAISLGLDSLRIVMLETPATTQEEAIAFKDRFGKKARVILVTDAVHMPRAIGYFKKLGIKVQAAPTNFLIRRDNHSGYTKWIPSIDNMQLMDRQIREWLGELKSLLSGA